MSATPQVRPSESEISPIDSGDPIELLRNVVSQLRSSNGGLPDKAQVTKLLEEAHEALERANVIARAMAECQECLDAAEFDRALQSIDAGLIAYPDDPALVLRRREVESQQQAFDRAARIRIALEEADWFAGQNRIDLAVQSLKEVNAELGGEAVLISRLQEIEALLPAWEQARNVQVILTRATELEQSQQWEAALMVLEEGLQSYADAAELAGAAQRLRNRLVRQERQRKLARRLERIRQQIAAQLWRQAGTLLESTQTEFPGEPELNSLRAEIGAGLRSDECQAVAAEVRQFLADGELEEAEQALSRGRQSLGPEPVLELLQQELESDRDYREELRAAQICLGRGQLEEAEHILAAIADSPRPEALALLRAVKQARDAKEEDNFFDRGREKALALMQQAQFAQAADLLCNLLSLFPGDAILERDLAAARNGLKREPPETAKAAEAEDRAASPVVSTTPQSGTISSAPGGQSAPSRFRRATVIGSASLLVIAATGAALKRAHRSAPIDKPPVAAALVQTPAESRVPATQATTVPPAPPEAKAIQKASPTEPNAVTAAVIGPRVSQMQPLRQFVPPNSKQMADRPDSALPLPPGTESIRTAEPVRVLPGNLGGSVNAPAPPPPAPPKASPVPAVAERPSVPVGGRLKEAQLIRRIMPVYPPMARQRGISGSVKMEATVDEHGNVADVKVLSGHVMLVPAAKAALLQWKYVPAILNDRPVLTTVAVQIVFGDQNK
jgi:protein TonB